MKKTISMLCVVLVVGFAVTAIAAPKQKVAVCHNGSVYDEVINELPAEYSQDAWVPGSFVINISENAVRKHEVNHGDSTDFSVDGLPLVITEVEVIEGVITDFEEQQSCVPIISEP
jgi:hypothetical protein